MMAQIKSHFSPNVRVASLFITLLVLVFTSCSNEPIHNQNELANGAMALRLDSHLVSAIDRGFSGAVLVEVNNELILRKGYGWTDSTQEHRITPDTQFFIASMTKGITGATVLRAQEKGLLSLSDTLSSFLPGLSGPFSKITMHQLLSHTSGMGSGYTTFGYTERDDNMREVLDSDLASELGVDFQYTGAGFWLAAALVEREANIPYEQFVRNEIFVPAGMTNTDFWINVDDLNRSIVAQKMHEFPPEGQQPNWGYRGSGGIVSNISDMYAWFNAVARGELLSQESKEALFDAHVQLGSGIGVGYGWYRSETARGTKVLWSRGGESFGHNAVLRWFEEEDVLVIVLTNAGMLDGHDEEANRTISRELEELVFGGKVII